jgi:hypothetical protein
MHPVMTQAMNVSCSVNVAITCPALLLCIPAAHSCVHLYRSHRRADRDALGALTVTDRSQDGRTRHHTFTTGFAKHPAPSLVRVFLATLTDGSLLDITCFIVKTVFPLLQTFGGPYWFLLQGDD